MHESNTLPIDHTQYTSSQQQQQQHQQPQEQLQGTIDKHFENDSTYKSSSDSDENNKSDANNDWNFHYSETRDNEEQQKKFEQSLPFINENGTSSDQSYRLSRYKTLKIKPN